MDSPFILFDLDNTLYPPSSGVMSEMNRRMSRFVADYFGVDESEAMQLRKGKPGVFGTTLQWLRVCHGLADPEPYIKAVHPENMDEWVDPDLSLRRFLEEIPNEYVLFTNSPIEHAVRTLKALGLYDLFPRIWDLRRMGYKGKPHQDAYRRVLGDLGLVPSDCLLVDDSRPNIDGFQALGGKAFFVHHAAPAEWVPELRQHLEA